MAGTAGAQTTPPFGFGRHIFCASAVADSNVIVVISVKINLISPSLG